MLKVLSVSEFISQINGLIAGEFVVEGEVSGFRPNSEKRYTFFDVKDESAALSCLIWNSQLTVPLEDGMKVRLVGYPEIYAKSGKFSFKVQKIELVGEGSLKKAYLLLKQKLEAEGLFTPERKRPLPALPRRIGVITSRDAAAFGDFKRILNNRWGGLEVDLYHAQVQGASAAGDIVAAFAYFNARAGDYDVLALIRGGGSLEDLAAFNSEEVARAVYGSKVPVVCGVGHERDETLVDFVADARASTPSNAAEIIAPDRRDFITGLEFNLNQLGQTLEHALTKRRRGLEQNFYLISSRFEAPLAASRSLLDKFSRALAYLGNALTRQREFVLSSERLFNNVNPRRVLSRGYSITRDAVGRIIRAAAQVAAGDEIVVELSQGSIAGEVKSAAGKRAGQGSLL